jgi:AbrB family looped-hinge helix DNA binding protein
MMMVAKKAAQDACCSESSSMCCSGVKALVTVDVRGQMVLPKEIRQRANIRGGDKLAVVAWQRGDRICCISLIKAEELTQMVTDVFGPVAEDISEE